MIRYLEGDLLNSPAQVLVNTVNTVGVMGKGIALQFKKRYPKMFEEYRKQCEKKRLTIGKLMIWYEADHTILLFPTKEHWRNPSKLEYIEKGLMAFSRRYVEYNITSIAFPKLGCGNGELNWEEVKPLMEKYLKNLPIDIYIYVGINNKIAPEHKKQKETMKWLKSHAKDMSFNGVRDDIAHTCAIVPYEFTYKGKTCTAEWTLEKGLSFTLEDNNYTVPEERLEEIWNKMRAKGAFTLSEKEGYLNMVYAFLASLDYLTEVRIQDKSSLIMKDGYQIDEGLGRAYVLRG